MRPIRRKMTRFFSWRLRVVRAQWGRPVVQGELNELIMQEQSLKGFSPSPLLPSPPPPSPSSLILLSFDHFTSGKLKQPLTIQSCAPAWCVYLHLNWFPYLWPPPQLNEYESGWWNRPVTHCSGPVFRFINWGIERPGRVSDTRDSQIFSADDSYF